MICLPARLPRRLAACAAAALAVGTLAVSAPSLAAQQEPGTYRLPPPSPTPTPRPAGPADERAGVAIPPRALPSGTPSAAPLGTPSTAATGATQAAAPSAAAPGPIPRASAAPIRESAPPARASAPLPTATTPGLAPLAEPALPPLADTPQAPSPAASGGTVPLAQAPPAAGGAADALAALPAWWPFAAGGLGALVLLGGGALVWRRRRKPKVLRLAAPAPARVPAADGAAEAALSAELPRLDLTLEVTGATRSVMMFTLHYRLAIANRTPRAANDLRLAVQIACARRGASNAASPGAAQALAQVERIGPHQSRKVTGTVQLPLAEIAVLQQGGRPLFIPLVHVTLDGAGHSALARSFVIGTPSAGGAGRVHPIVLEGPPGGLAGLVAQSIAIPPDSAAA